MKKLLTNLILCCLLGCLFVPTNAFSQASCIDLQNISVGECDGGYLSVEVYFSTNDYSNYNLFDGETLIGTNRGFGPAVGNGEDLLASSKAKCNNCIPHHIYGTIVGPVKAGTKKLKLVDAFDPTCFKEFNVTVSEDCSCTISNITGEAECREYEGNIYLGEAGLAVALTEDVLHAPYVTLTFTVAGGSPSYSSSYTAFYIDKDGFPVPFASSSFGATVLTQTSGTVLQKSSNPTTTPDNITISGFLDSDQTGNVTVYLVDENNGGILVEGPIAVPGGPTIAGPEGPIIGMPYERPTIADILAISACQGMTVVNIPDCGDDDGDGILNEVDPGDDRIDTDGDGIPDYRDPGNDNLDSDNDGTPDYLDFCDDNIDTDGDGTSDCRDKCPNDPTKIEPDACGCGTPPQIDSDGDGIVNCMDECPYDLDEYVDGRLECGRTVKSDTRLGERITESYGECSDILFAGRELFYKLTLHDAGAVTVRFKEIGSGTRELQLFVLDTLCSIDSCIGTIRGNPGTEETLVLEDLEAGDYYFAVDSRSFYDRAEFELTVDCGVGGTSMVTCPEDAVLSEDFEGYEAGTDIVSASGAFELFGASSTSSMVTTMEGETPNNAIYFNRNQGVSDINFVVPNQQRGIARVAWNMFVASNRGAYINIFGHESTANFGPKYQIATDDTALQDKWMAVEAYIDLDNNKYTLFVDNRAVVVTGDYLMGLERINFYAYWNNEFYIDNLCFSMVESVPTASRTASVENASLENVVKPATTIISNPQTYNGATTTATTYTQDLKVYPNPTKDILNVNLSLTTEMSMTLELIDQMGRTVQSIQTAKTNAINQQLNVSDLANGVYILRAYNKEVVLTKRIIKQ